MADKYVTLHRYRYKCFGVFCVLLCTVYVLPHHGHDTRGFYATPTPSATPTMTPVQSATVAAPVEREKGQLTASTNVKDSNKKSGRTEKGMQALQKRQLRSKALEAASREVHGTVYTDPSGCMSNVGMKMAKQTTFPQKSPLYILTYGLISFLISAGFELFLQGGSQLGAERHWGIIPWGDKDVDIGVFGSDGAMIEKSIYKVASSLQIEVAVAVNSFGFHIDMKGEKMYMDIWLWNRNSTHAQCVGITAQTYPDFFERWAGDPILKEMGCAGWFAAREIQTKWRALDGIPIGFILPIRSLPFGSKRVPVPQSARFMQELQQGIEADWQVNCGVIGRCADAKKRGYAFVTTSKACTGKNKNQPIACVQHLVVKNQVVRVCEI